MVYSTRRFVLSFARRYFVLVFFSPLSIAITSLGGARANLSAFRTFVRFAPIWFCLFPLPLGVWDGLRFVIVALPGLVSYIFLFPKAIFLRLFYVQSVKSSSQTNHAHSSRSRTTDRTRCFCCVPWYLFMHSLLESYSYVLLLIRRKAVFCDCDISWNVALLFWSVIALRSYLLNSSLSFPNTHRDKQAHTLALKPKA